MLKIIHCGYRKFEGLAVKADDDASDERFRIGHIVRNTITPWLSGAYDNYALAEKSVRRSKVAVAPDSFKMLLKDDLTVLQEDAFTKLMNDDLSNRIVCQARRERISILEVQRAVDICTTEMSTLVSAYFTGIFCGVLRVPWDHPPMWRDVRPS